MAMDSYQLLNVVGALNYLSMYPSMLVLPSVWAMVFMVEESALTETITKSILGLFLILLVVIVPTYAAAYKYDYKTFIDVSVAQRVIIVSLAIVTTAVVGQEPFPDWSFIRTMVMADVLLAVAHGFLADGGYPGIGERIWKLFTNTPIDSFHKSLRVESYVGMTFGFMAYVYAAVVSDILLSVVMSVVSCFIPYIWIWFNACDQTKAPRKLIFAHRLTIAAALLYLSEVEDFGVLNIVFRMQALALTAGAVSPYFGAITTGVSTLYLYKLGSDYVLTIPRGPFYWLSAWSIITVLTSYGWLFLFYDGYDEKQKKRVIRTHWQDRILGVFMFGLASTMEKAGHLATGTVGEPIVYLLPPVTLWFTLETKMLNHIQVGTPFHPSWWVDGDLPKFSPTDWVNVTFGVATALITVVLTSYAFYAVTTAVEMSSFGFGTKSTWKFATAHGILFIFHSGMWMIVASSGIPPIGDAPIFRAFPPELPPFIRCSPHDCVPPHKFDLAIGHILLVAGGLYLSDSVETAQLMQESMLTKSFVGAVWFISIIWKISVHCKGWGYVEPIKNKKD